jgi:glycosyltransferase involved in cell wall biosynthesis
MKILHIIASYKPAYIYGGPIMSVAKLCEELGLRGPQSGLREPQSGLREPRLRGPQSDIRIVVYTTLANGKEELHYHSGTVKMVDGVEVHYFKRLTKDHSHFSPALFWKLWRTAKDYDVIHIHAWWNLVSVFSCLIGILKGCKIVLTPRGTLSNYSFNSRTSALKKVFHRFIGRPLLKSCYIHTTSKREEIDMQNLLDPKYINTIPNLVELPWKEMKELAKQREPFNGTLRLIFLSRIEQKKGLELLFEILAQVTFTFKLEIAGTGEPEYIFHLKKMSEKLGISAHINWLGMLNKNEKFLQLAKNDLFVLPSFDENFANVVIESLFTGTPVLITENVGLSDYVKEKNLGWICERTAFSLTENLQKAYEGIQTHIIHSEYLVETIINDYKEDKIINRYWDLYDEVRKSDSHKALLP